MFKEYKKSLNKALETLSQDKLDILYEEIKKRLNGSSAIHILGNGGSAANASHIVGDYRKTFAFMKLKINIKTHSDNACYLTAASNDLDFNEIYSSLVSTVIDEKDWIKGFIEDNTRTSKKLINIAITIIEKNSIIYFLGRNKINFIKLTIFFINKYFQ